MLGSWVNTLQKLRWSTWLTGAKPCGMALLCLTLGWTYTAHQRCNKSIADCQNLSEGSCACEQHIFRFFHTSNLMRLTHRHARMKRSLANQHVWLVAKKVAKCVSEISPGVRVCMCLVWGNCVSIVSLERLIRVGVEESATVKSPWALSPVLTPLNLSLSSLTFTHSTSIDTRFPAALQRPEENPLQWLSVQRESLGACRDQGDYIMRRHTEQ